MRLAMLALVMLLPAAAAAQQRGAATDALALMGKAASDDPVVKAFTGDMKYWFIDGAARIDRPIRGAWLAMDGEQRATGRHGDDARELAGRRPLYRGPFLSG
jgi:hypothetical protein